MSSKQFVIALAVSVLASAAWAQTSTSPTGTPPLNLKLPANGNYSSPSATASNGSAPAHSSTAAPSVKPANVSTAPGVYYGDTSGTRQSSDESTASSAGHCDDYDYAQPQVHGSVGMGVVSGSHIGTGTYTGGDVNVTKNLGTCDHPSGSVGVSIGVSRFGGFNH